ncbi:MAG: hypothetical protein IMF19_14755 [Proteobacteria bacterium]|nr:hypothetical protein [Pseudomonadota bacterium]
MIEREEICFKNEVYDKEEKVVHYKRPWMAGKSIFYKNRIYVSKGVDKISRVKYILHPTFPNPVRTVTNKDKNFELIFWAWGGFQMEIIVTDTDGEIYNYGFSTRLNELLREAKADKSVKWNNESLADQIDI